jgi:hypothetical protein
MDVIETETLALDWVGSTELVEQTGISYRQCQSWTVQGRLVTIDGGPRGSGKPARYPPSEVAVARMLKVLVGLNAADLDKIAQMVREGFQGEVIIWPGVRVDLAVVCSSG